MSEIPASPLPRLRPVSRSSWVLGYLLFSVGAPFVCLRMAGAISTLECIFGLLSTAIVQAGFIPVLAQTDGHPMQSFVLMSMSLSFYLLGFWQFWAGERRGLWTPEGRKGWRLAGRFFGGFLVITMTLNLAVFQLLKLPPR